MLRFIADGGNRQPGLHGISLPAIPFGRGWLMPCVRMPKRLRHAPEGRTAELLCVCRIRRSIHLGERILAKSADRADPGIRDVLEGRTGSNSAVGIDGSWMQPHGHSYFFMTPPPFKRVIDPQAGKARRLPRITHGIIPQTSGYNKDFLHRKACFHPRFCAVSMNLRKRIELRAHS